MKTFFLGLRKFLPSSPLAIAVCALGLFAIEPAFAQQDPANPAILGLASILSIAIHILTFIVLLVMSLGGDLIGTTFITGPDAMEAIRPMWIFIRNLVNISFVLVLLFLAFANLFSSLGGQGGNWTIKDKLPRVIIALIAVNFSLLMFRVAIDAVHVGTITILSIADVAIEEKEGYNIGAILNTGIDNVEFAKCEDPIDFKNLNHPSPNNKVIGTQCVPFYAYVEHALCPGGGGSDCLVKFSNDAKDPENAFIKASSSTERNIFWAFGTYFQKLELLPMLAGKLNSITGVVSSTLFSAIMAIMYAVAWLAIFVALTVRIVMLWFFMILSPMLVAAQVMGIGGGGSMGNFNIQQSLVTNLIMPLKIATAFALSFVMIAAMIKVSPDNYTTILEAGEALRPFWGVETGPFSILWQVMTIVVFWMAVWWALSGSEAEFINNGIKTATEQTGKYVGSWALDRVRIPAVGKDGQGMSVRALSPQNLKAVLGSAQAESDRKNRQDLSQAFNLNKAGVDAFNQIERFFGEKQNVEAKDIIASGTFTGEAISAGSQKQVEKIVGQLADTERENLKNALGITGNVDNSKIAETMRGLGLDEQNKAYQDAGFQREKAATTTSTTTQNINVDILKTPAGDSLASVSNGVAIEVKDLSSFNSLIAALKEDIRNGNATDLSRADAQEVVKIAKALGLDAAAIGATSLDAAGIQALVK